MLRCASIPSDERVMGSMARHGMDTLARYDLSSYILVIISWGSRDSNWAVLVQGHKGGTADACPRPCMVSVELGIQNPYRISELYSAVEHPSVFRMLNSNTLITLSISPALFQALLN